MNKFRTIFKTVFGAPKASLPLNEHGVYLLPRPDLRKYLALKADGTLWLAGAEPNLFLGYYKALIELRDTYDIPPPSNEVICTVTDIAALYGSSGQQSEAAPNTAGVERMRQTLIEAAALNASDIKLIQRRDHADLRLKLGSHECTHGSQWQVQEAKDAMRYIYDTRDDGDGSAALLRGTHQGFSIGRDGKLPLPSGVVALRGQRGFHGDGHEFLVMRLIYNAESGGAGTLEDLGFDQEVLDALKVERTSDNGLVIIGGSTGDGKSTTLVRVLDRLHLEREGHVSIVTVEDPVEYPIPGDGVLQIPVPAATTAEERRAAFADTLRCFVRINPDIGMVSEVRSVDDAREILQFVISGHKIFTTVHASSANEVLFRLISLGVNPKELSSPDMVNLVMRQKLVPILCTECSSPAEGAALNRILEWCGDANATPRLRNHAGCETCLANRTDPTACSAWGGLARKQAVAEIIRVDNTYRRFLEERDPIGAEAYWRKPKEQGGLGGRTVAEKTRDLVAQGLVDYTDATHETNIEVAA